MERITVPGPDGGFSVPAGLEQEAAERLGRYEDAYERLTARRSELAGRMEALKAQGKQKTAQFRELFAEKLTIQNTLTLWRLHGIHCRAPKDGRRPRRRPSRAHGD